MALAAAAAAGQVTGPARVGVGVIQTRLSLREALETALRNNLEVEIERSNTALAAEALKAARGAWDPTFRWLPGGESRNTPVGSVLQGAGGKLSETFFTSNFYFRQRLPRRSTLFSVDFENARATTTNSFASLNPLQTSRLVVGFTQPLLRNRAVDRERAELRIRARQLDISEVDFELRVIDVITRVEQAYWDLVAARQDAEVKADGVAWAREQLARNQRMIASGSLAPVELSASEAELQRRLDTWYASVGAVTEVENALKLLIASDRGAPVWAEELIPADASTSEPPESDDLRKNVGIALDRRPELRQIGLRKDVNDVQRQAAADQTKPQVNLVASYANAGMGGSIREGDNPITASNAALYDRLNRLSALAGLAPVAAPGFGGPPGLLIGGYGTALSNLFGGNYQSAQVGLAMDFTFRNRTAEANLAQTVISERRLKLERARLEQGIEAQVRNALQALQTARQRIAAAEAGARAAKEKLDSETRLFQTGESTNFLVLTRQNEYLDSRRRAVAAHLDFNKAVARACQALGTTLQVHNISLK